MIIANTKIIFEIRNKNIVIQNTGKGNTVVIIDKEKYIEGVKNVISYSFKFLALNLPPENDIKYIANVEKKIKKLLLTYVTIIKSVKMSYSKFFL